MGSIQVLLFRVPGSYVRRKMGDAVGVVAGVVADADVVVAAAGDAAALDTPYPRFVETDYYCEPWTVTAYEQAQAEVGLLSREAFHGPIPVHVRILFRDGRFLDLCTCQALNADGCVYVVH